MFDHLLKYKEEFSQKGQVTIRNLSPKDRDWETSSLYFKR